MKNNFLKSIPLIVVFLFAPSVLANTNAQHNLSTQQLGAIKQDLQKVVADAQQQFNLIGSSVAVLLPGQQKPLTLTVGKTLIDNGKPITSTSIFQVGSITKTFTAAIVAKAINENHLSLDDKLGKYFPEYSLWKDITIGELLNQTSGIFDYIDSEDWWQKVEASNNKIWDAKSLVNIAYQYPLNFRPRTSWAYTNTNYVLLGMVLEKVTHKSMHDLMSALIQKTNLQNTFYLPKKYPESMAHGYGFYDKTYDMTNQNGSIWHAAGAIVASPENLVRWMHTLFATPIIQRLHLKSTMNGKGVTSLDEAGYDFGLFRMNTPEGIVWFTPGLTSGYISAIVYAPCNDLYFAYSTNKAPAKGLHEFIMMHILHAVNSNKSYQEFVKTNTHLPDFCSQTKPTAKFVFPLR